MEINGVGNKNCWIKNWSQHWWFFNRGGLLILGDHLFLNYMFVLGQRGLINTAGIINPNLALSVTNLGRNQPVLKFSSETVFVKGNPLRILNTDQFPRMGPRTDRSNAAAWVWVYIWYQGVGIPGVSFLPSSSCTCCAFSKEYAHRKATVSFWCQLQEVGIWSWLPSGKLT